MDGISVAGLVLGISSGLVLFIKGIKKCKCTKRGISLEREYNDEVGRQQEFTLKLVELLNTYPTSCPVEGSEGVSEISEDVIPEIKNKMTKMLEILKEENSPPPSYLEKPTFKAMLSTKKERKAKKKPQLKKDIVNSRELNREMSQSDNIESSSTKPKEKKITPFIANRSK